MEAALASWSLSINSLEWASTHIFQLDKLEFSDFVDLPPADARRPVRFYAHDFRKVEMQRGDLVHAVAFMCISLSLSICLPCLSAVTAASEVHEPGFDRRPFSWQFASFGS